MPEFPPSILKPTDNHRLKRITGSQEAKAKAYDSLRPGTTISEGQKAERYDLMNHRAENGAINRRRRTAASSITIPRIPWHENKD